MDRIKYETFSVSSWLRVSDTLSRNLLSSSLLVCSSANKLSYHTNSTIITRSCNQTDVLKLNIGSCVWFVPAGCSGLTQAGCFSLWCCWAVWAVSGRHGSVSLSQSAVFVSAFSLSYDMSSALISAPLLLFVNTPKGHTFFNTAHDTKLLNIQFAF